MLKCIQDDFATAYRNKITSVSQLTSLCRLAYLEDGITAKLCPKNYVNSEYTRVYIGLRSLEKRGIVACDGGESLVWSFTPDGITSLGDQISMTPTQIEAVERAFREYRLRHGLTTMVLIELAKSKTGMKTTEIAKALNEKLNIDISSSHVIAAVKNNLFTIDGFRRYGLTRSGFVVARLLQDASWGEELKIAV